VLPPLLESLAFQRRSGSKDRMRIPSFLVLILLSASLSAGPPKERLPVDVKIIAINDFHGALLPPKLAVEATDAKGEYVRVPAGGVAYLATAVDQLRRQNPNTALVSAGDMIGASPIQSALFLDEPTIHAMNMLRLDFNALGNHEFDRGRAELLRMQRGGCAKNTIRMPCRVDRRFRGAAFRELAANTITETGKTLFPGTGIKDFGRGRNRVRIGFIGLTLQGTANLASPAGIVGIHFADEAASANAQVPILKAKGADAIVLLIHQGLTTKVSYNDKSCGGVTGDLLAVLEKLDPRVDVVVSGHTHNAYVCDYGKINPQKPFLVTSAMKVGMLVTDINLRIDPVTHRVVAKSADNIIVQSEAYTGARGLVPLSPDFQQFVPRPDLADLAARYVAAAKEEESRVVGSLAGAAPRSKNEAGESILGNLIADAQWAATRDPSKGGAQFALMNPDGIRTDIVPSENGDVTFGSVFATQPFANTVNVKSMSGRHVKALLEQQFNDPNWTRIFSPSEGFRFAFDMSRPEGQRILELSLNGAPLADNMIYRVAMNSFLAVGGDKFSVFLSGTEEVVGPTDLDAIMAYLSNGKPKPLPALNRVTNRTPK
jgi:5'-nucleotidase